MFLLLRG